MSYTVKAKRWDGGWELHISRDGQDVGVTQARRLTKAEQVARDYIATLYDLDEVTDEVTIIPEIDKLGAEVVRARQMTREAEAAQRAAAAERRKVARALRDKGLTVPETAAVLGVSPGRVSQMIGEPRELVASR